MTRILEELGIHVISLYKWMKTWRLQGEEVPASIDQHWVGLQQDHEAEAAEVAGVLPLEGEIEGKHQRGVTARLGTGTGRVDPGGLVSAAAAG